MLIEPEQEQAVRLVAEAILEKAAKTSVKERHVCEQLFLQIQLEIGHKRAVDLIATTLNGQSIEFTKKEQTILKSLMLPSRRDFLKLGSNIAKGTLVTTLLGNAGIHLYWQHDLKQQLDQANANNDDKNAKEIQAKIDDNKNNMVGGSAILLCMLGGESAMEMLLDVRHRVRQSIIFHERYPSMLNAIDEGLKQKLAIYADAVRGVG